MQPPTFTARDAAQRYAEDEEFAKEFDATLTGLYKEHVARLERLAQKVGAIVSDVTRPLRSAHPRTTGTASALKLTSEQLVTVLRSSSEPMTRGKIALQLGLDSKDLTLTRLLRALKKDGIIRQRGDRRGARYSLAAAPVKRRRSPGSLDRDSAT